jgi:hypothetical protein
MKHLLLQLFTLLSISLVYAQPQANDSISLGAGYTNDVFYSYENGTVANVPGNNWHIAFSARPAAPPMDVMRSAAILVNEGRGVALYRSNQTQWANFDTTNYLSWPNPHNSDTSWDVGAFNAIRVASNPFDFGWGTYSMQTHDVQGNAIFLTRVIARSGPVTDTSFYKIRIEKLAYDTQWVFTFSKLDGTDSNRVTIGKGNYTGKLFAYYNLKTKTVIDREPSAPWDVLFTRYGTFTTQFAITLFGATTGVLNNPAIRSAKVFGKPEDSISINDAVFNPFINTIGTDWKINPGPGQPNFIMHDSTVYFVRLANNKQYRMAFRSFEGNSTGKITFYKAAESPFTSLKEWSAKPVVVNVYPNPAKDFINVQTGIGNHVVNIYDLTGRLRLTVSGSENVTIDISSLQNGIYFIQVDGNKSARFIVE